jgi:spermidine synthase
MLASGAAALIYQVTWARLLSLSIGSTSAAIAIVLAAFFLGLALGAWLSENIKTKQVKNIRHYLWLEVTIGLTSLALLPILLNLDAFVTQWPNLASYTGFKFVLVTILIGIPTTCIGATFPIMVTLLSQQGYRTGLRLGQLYGLNTTGGVLGAALGGFVLIPNWGLDGSTYIAASLNFAIVIAGILSIIFTQKDFTGNKTQDNDKSNSATQSAAPTNKPLADVNTRRQALFVLFVTGMVSLACEVSWTKYLSIYTHTTIYGFAAILSIFLTGIAAGAWAINHWLNRIIRPQLWINVGLLALGASLILTQLGLNALPDIQKTLFETSTNVPMAESSKYFLVFVLLFLPTFLFGGLFTLNLRFASGDTDSLSHPVGKAYAINTLGGIVGALCAGLWMIPQFGSSTVLTITIIIILLTVLMFVTPGFASLKTGTINIKMRMILVTLTGLLTLFTFLLPPLDFRKIISADNYYFLTGPNTLRDSSFHFLREGRSGVVSVTGGDGQDFYLQKNGLPESFVNLSRPYALLAETLLGLTPWLLHPKPRNAFVIGLGGATTVQALTLTDLTSIRVLELEPVVRDAVESIYGGEIPALRDPRVELVFDDARQRLLLEEQNYDLIISQPSHPWTAGGANLFSRDFFRLARSRLTEDGIYTQWLNLFHMDAQTLQSILQAFYDEFPFGISLIIFQEEGLLLLGSQAPLRLDAPTLQTRLARPAIRKVLESRDLRQPYDLLRYLALSREEALTAANNAIPATDTNLIPEVRLGHLKQKPTGADDPYQLLRKHYQSDLSAYFRKEDLVDHYKAIAEYFEPFDPMRAQLIRAKINQ